MTIGGIVLHDLHIEDLRNPLHPSTFEEHEEYRIMILSLPEKIKHNPTIRPYGFILTDETIYYYDPKEARLTPLAEGLHEMYRFLDSKIDPIMADIDNVSEKIIFLEESLYKKVSRAFMKHWHELKKELSRTERVLRKAVDVLERFIYKTAGTDHFPINEFRDVHEHLERTLRSVIAANEQLDNLYQYYNLRSGDRLNRSIYILTVISVIFLPLNLVVGFFGMNTGGLPFQDHPAGTAYAFVTMILFALALAAVILWKIKKE
ncbi:MAG: CorA family divalent cation transporter [Sulfuricurvum sp.]|jgi:magnesium transporter|nr:CorA family divalent cation transporter [Sulfuricurvum sp.]